jgi:hypothetical protein
MDTEPFLLHRSSRAFLDGDRRGIQERFAFRRDALDYLAMASIAAGVLLILVDVARMRGWLARDSEQDASISAMVVGGLLIVVGGYFVSSRHRVAAARARLIVDGAIVTGTIVSCTGRDELETGYGKVTRSYRVTVEYRFSAGGEEMTGHDEQDRPDLRRIELPPAGTVVRVLYLDDHTYAVL